MGRPIGSKNEGYDDRRNALARAVLPRLLEDDGHRASLADLASAAGVSVPTIKHYFGGREGLVAACLRTLRDQGAPHVAMLRVPPEGMDLERSLRDVIERLRQAWTIFGVGRVFGAGLAVGIHDAVAGPGYVDGILEPTLQALEARLRVHAARGEIVFEHEDDVRVAALEFLSPLLVALLHQHELGGARCRPLDLDAFGAAHLRRFLRAWT